MTRHLVWLSWAARRGAIGGAVLTTQGSCLDNALNLRSLGATTIQLETDDRSAKWEWTLPLSEPEPVEDEYSHREACEVRSASELGERDEDYAGDRLHDERNDARLEGRS